jgi:membrane-associated protease RseP (regulator of RpoE activity)
MKLLNKILLTAWILVLTISLVLVNIIKLSTFKYYDLHFLILFSALITFFLYRKRKNLKREGIAYLYRTRVGIKVINYIGDNYRKTLKVLGYFSIVVGYLLMVSMIYLLVKSIGLFLQPEFVKAVKIPPIAPLIPYLPEIFKVDFLPPFYFTYWIIALGIVAVVHEFSHGIFAKLNNIKIKSTGFLFLGPFFGAFVEPDEKKMKKLKKVNQIAILSAGTFSNVLLVILFSLILWVFFALSFTAGGVIFSMYSFDSVNVSEISGIGSATFLANGLNLTKINVADKNYYIDSKQIDNLNKSEFIYAYEDSPALNAGLSGIIIEIGGKKIRNSVDFRSELLKSKPGDSIVIITLQNTTRRDYTIVLGQNPANKSMPYLGIALPSESPQKSILGRVRGVLTFFRDPSTYYAPRFSTDLIDFIYDLLWWIILINFSVALVNMLPVGIFDGGRVFYLTVWGLTKREKFAKISSKVATYIILGIFVLLMLLWIYAFI